MYPIGWILKFSNVKQKHQIFCFFISAYRHKMSVSCLSKTLTTHIYYQKYSCSPRDCLYTWLKGGKICHFFCRNWAMLFAFIKLKLFCLIWWNKSLGFIYIDWLSFYILLSLLDIISWNQLLISIWIIKLLYRCKIMLSQVIESLEVHTLL